MAARKRKASGHDWTRKKKTRPVEEAAVRRVSKPKSRIASTRRFKNVSKPKSSKTSATGSEKCSAAVEAVFNTAELLENILVHVEFYSLLRAQRVCTLFRDAIAGSTAIKQRLFLSGEEKRDRWAVVGNAVKDLRIVQLAPDAVLPPPRPIAADEGLPWAMTPKELFPVSIHPLLMYKEPYGRSRLVGKSEEPVALDAVMSGFPSYYLRHDLHGCSAGAAWREMYVCNPPCTKMDAEVTFEVKRSPEHSTTVLLHFEEASGITFGTLIDRAMEAQCMSKNGKKCCPGEQSAAAYIEELERINGRPAYVRASMQSGVVGTIIRPKGVVSPGERLWREVAAAAPWESVGQTLAE